MGSDMPAEKKGLSKFDILNLVIGSIIGWGSFILPGSFFLPKSGVLSTVLGLCIGGIFVTTGYSDGLTRVGDYYIAHDNTLEALRMYCLAKNKRKSDPIIDSLVRLIRVLIDTETKGVENV